MLKEFKDFALKGNVVDMAVGIIIGAAFGKVVTSAVSDILMPPVGLLMGKVDFSSLFVALNGESYPSLVAAKAAGAPTLNVGLFLNTITDFVMVSAAIFLVVRQMSKLRLAGETKLTKQEELLSEIRDLLKSERKQA